MLLQKKKRKKKRRRLKIFDIIDNIPLTSDSDSDVEPLRKHSKERNNIAELPNLGLTFLPPYTNKNSVKETSKITNTTQQTLPEPPRDLYKPKVSRFLDPNNKKDDPLSWENIIKDVRRETRETQTEKPQKENNLVTQEIQTEINDMIDIPRTQTFFTDQKDHVSDKTKEFCDRVRNEVLQKLDHLQSLEEKSCQTISHASVQTDEIKNDKVKGDSSVQQRNVRFKEVKLTLFCFVCLFLLLLLVVVFLLLLLHSLLFFFIFFLDFKSYCTTYHRLYCTVFKKSQTMFCMQR